jgi:hypothetical protein
MLRIEVERVIVPIGSTIGFGAGRTEDGATAVIFAGDHRAMAALGEVIAQSDEPIFVDVPEWVVLERHKL